MSSYFLLGMFLTAVGVFRRWQPCRTSTLTRTGGCVPLVFTVRAFPCCCGRCSRSLATPSLPSTTVVCLPRGPSLVGRLACEFRHASVSFRQTLGRCTLRVLRFWASGIVQLRWLLPSFVSRSPFLRVTLLRRLVFLSEWLLSTRGSGFLFCWTLLFQATSQLWPGSPATPPVCWVCATSLGVRTHSTGRDSGQLTPQHRSRLSRS